MRGKVGLAFYTPATVRDFLQWTPESLLAHETGPDGLAGIEAALWSETVRDFTDAQFLLLPRLPGVAEKAWAQPGPLDWDTYRERLAAQAPTWNRRGWRYFRSSLVDWPTPAA
jgi:hexosaminidase